MNFQNLFNKICAVLDPAGSIAVTLAGLWFSVLTLGWITTILLFIAWLIMSVTNAVNIFQAEAAMIMPEEEEDL